MSEESQRASNVVKGAIVALKSTSKSAITDSNSSTFIFQYNPEMLIRTIYSPEAAMEKDLVKLRTDVNSPVEIISLSLELDTEDQVEQPEQNKEVTQYGLHPTLAVLESIVNSQYESASPELLFLWGPNRMLPISVDSARIVEEAFDLNLNPIRARIELCMRVRNLSELKTNSVAYSVYANFLNKRRTFTETFGKNALKSVPLEKIHQIISKRDEGKISSKARAKSVERISKLRKLSER